MCIPSETLSRYLLIDLIDSSFIFKLSIGITDHSVLERALYNEVALSFPREGNQSQGPGGFSNTHSQLVTEFRVEHSSLFLPVLLPFPFSS